MNFLSFNKILLLSISFTLSGSLFGMDSLQRAKQILGHYLGYRAQQTPAQQAPLQKAPQYASETVKDSAQDTPAPMPSIQEKAIERATHLTAHIDDGKFNQEKFDHYAAQYGNKAANLAELQKISSSIPVKGKCVQVPAFFAISDEEVQQFFKPICQNLTRYCNGFTFCAQKAAHYKKLKEEYLSKTYQRQINNLLLKITKEIENLFEKNIFRFSNNKRQEEFQNYIKQAVSNQDLFMVRSTGKEDTKELANAGGNKSIIAVWPHEEAISKAIGQVVASYFSEKSISQRLLAGDTSIGSLFMPVVIQIMVSKDPVSGVMFSQEAEGNTPGVTHIQAAYGHGEGIVNSIIPVDSYYIGPSKIIHPIVRPKTHKLVPSMDFTGVESEINSKELANNPCLSPVMIQDLKTTADYIQHYYGYPVDIEFVVQEGRIYLVQARPIVSRPIKPSYLKDEFVKKLQKKISAFPIVTAGGKVQRVDDEYKAITTKTIGQALETFLAHDMDQEKTSAIIITQLAPPTSHEATTFRGAGKPVVCVSESDLELLRQWSVPLLLDVQRGLIIPFVSSAQFPNPQSAVVENAWFIHPIPQKTSLFPQFISLQQMPEIKPEECCKNIKTTALIEVIKNGSAQEARNALKSILFRISHQISLLQQKAAQNSTLRISVLQFKNMFAHLITCAQEVALALNQWEQSRKTLQDRMARLYPITFFEALLCQTSNANNFVNDYSFASFLKIDAQEEKLAQEIPVTKKTYRPFAIQYAKIGKQILFKEVSQTWNNFIMTMQDAPLKTQQQLAHMICDLAKQDMLSVWLNISFATAIKNTLIPQEIFAEEIFAALLNEYILAKPLLEKLANTQEQLKQIVQTNWQSPDLFEKNWKHFLNVTFAIDQGFYEKYEKASLIEKLAIQKYLNNFISIFDTIIKTVKSSQEYKDKNQLIERFRLMLNSYFHTLETLYKIPSIRNDVINLLTSDVFSAIKSIIQYASNSEGQLHPTPEFNVAAAAIGSKANFARSIGAKPSLEDMFTLIHQNLLVVMRLLNEKLNLENIFILSPLAKEVIQQTKNMNFAIKDISAKSSLIGIDMVDNNIIYYFNLPLANHSSTFQIAYNPQKETFVMSVQFLGQARSRFGIMANHLKGYHERPEAPKLIFCELNENKGLLSFSWEIKSVLQLNQAIENYKYLAELTFR